MDILNNTLKNANLYKEKVEYTFKGKTFMCDHYYYYDDYGYSFKYTTTELDKINLDLLYKAYKSL